MKRVAAIFWAVSLSATGLSALAVGTAHADPSDHRSGRDDPRRYPHQQDDARRGPGAGAGYGYGAPRANPAAQGRVIPLSGVVGQFKRRFPTGRLLDAEMGELDGRPVYHVHWATGEGRRIDYLVDARTGQVIGED